MVYLTYMDERYSLLIGLNYSSDCGRWSVVAESPSDAEIRNGDQDKWSNSGIWSNTGEIQDDEVSHEEIELYRQICVWRAAVKYVTQIVSARYDIRPGMQRLLKDLFPNKPSVLEYVLTFHSGLYAASYS